MKKRILFLSAITWELPQTILAVLLLVFSRSVKSGKTQRSGVIYRGWTLSTASFSLGHFIFIGYESGSSDYALRHEYGHSIQSLYLGPLYLLVVALPTLVQDILVEIQSKKVAS